MSNIELLERGIDKTEYTKETLIIVNEKYIFRLLLADMQVANVVCGSARQ